jgi:hypothetical protein
MNSEPRREPHFGYATNSGRWPEWVAHISETPRHPSRWRQHTSPVNARYSGATSSCVWRQLFDGAPSIHLPPEARLRPEKRPAEA